MKIALIGYGKMGHAIEEIAAGRGHQIVLAINVENTEDFTEENIREAEVAIEFSHPDSAFKNIQFCLNCGIPVVSGTTGWLQHYGEIEQLCKEKNGTFLYASNFSIGVNIFFELNRQLAKLMQGRNDYDVQITETHHIHKMDAPSGTAISLAKDIIQSGIKKTYSNTEEQKPDNLIIKSIREGEVPGTHLVKYFGENDQIEIIHTAHSRKGFAAGAVAAAEYVKDKKGIFTMKEVLGIG